MYRCQNCGQQFEQFEILGQCPHCSHLSKVKCACGYVAEGWDFVKNDDCCPKCKRPMRVAGGGSAHNKEMAEKEKRSRTTVVIAAVLGLAAVAVGAVLFFMLG
jgi:hypothetical protein